jgi:predicted RNase H-like nuclease (RuvC/YqgF family)
MLSKEVQAPKEGKKPGRATPGTQSKERRAMASSSKGPMSIEERLKQMETTLANLQQMLQHQLDFLENLDVEAGRRLEQLESDITMTKIEFAEELDKLNQELKNPQQDFDERMEQLEAKMAQLNSNWNKDEEK